MRSRTARRQRQQIARREQKDLQRDLVRRGLAERRAKVNATVHPSSPIFWHVLKNRIAARETLSPIRDRETLRMLAEHVLAEEGVDMTGIALKMDWRPPRLLFWADIEHETALQTVAAVQGSDRGARRAAKLATIR